MPHRGGIQHLQRHDSLVERRIRTLGLAVKEGPFATHHTGLCARLSATSEDTDTDEWEKKPPPEPVRRRSVGRGG
jgi:hypothetical protein